MASIRHNVRRRNAAGRDAAGQNTAGRDAAGRDTAGRDAAGRDAAGHDAASADAVGQNAGRPRSASDDALLDAARHCILAVGWKRTTLTEVARRAGVSRMTIYRRWPDMQTLLSDLMTREWSGVVAGTVAGGSGAARRRLATGVAATVAALRDNELFRRIVQVDPELLLPYLLGRRGRTQDSVLELLEDGVRQGQRDGSVRKGSPTRLAQSILLSAHGFTLSAQTMTDDPARLDSELRDLVDRYLSP